jgi:hypothetical protein
MEQFPKCTILQRLTDYAVQIAVWLLPAYLSLSESLNQTIGSSPDAARSDGSRLFLVFVALLPNFKIPKHTNIHDPLSL